MRAWIVGIAVVGREWPDLVVRRDVQFRPRGRLGNEFGRDIAAC